MFHMLIYRTFHAQRSYLQPLLTKLGLGAGQPKLLTYLAGRGPCSQKELADYFEIDPAAVCRMLDTLERNGFVARTPGRDSRRTGRVLLTDRGRQAQQAWADGCRQMEEQVMLLGFTEEERSRFSGYLSRAYRNLRGSRAEGGDAP